MYFTKSNIIFEDNHLIIVNKPAGILVQGDKTGDKSLIDLVKEYLKVKYSKKGNVFLGLVNRIDRPTSGIVILSKTSKALSRMNSLIKAIKDDETYLNILTCQIVSLIQNKQKIKMSKRSGNFVTLANVHSKVGKDPIRYYMISTKNETAIDFDLDAVVEKNKDNKVFYCQYAHARASSVINKANELGIKIKNAGMFIKPMLSGRFTFKYDPVIKKPIAPNEAIIKPIAAALPIALLIGYPKYLNIGTFMTAPPIPIGADTNPEINPKTILGSKLKLGLVSCAFSLKNKTMLALS